MSQLEFVSLDSLLPSTHSLRRFQAYVADAPDVLADVVPIKSADAAFIKDSPFQTEPSCAETENRYHVKFRASNPVPPHPLSSNAGGRSGRVAYPSGIAASFPSHPLLWSVNGSIPANFDSLPPTRFDSWFLAPMEWLPINRPDAQFLVQTARGEETRDSGSVPFTPGP